MINEQFNKVSGFYLKNGKYQVKNCEFKIIRGNKVDGSKVFDLSKVIGLNEIIEIKLVNS